MAKDKTFSCSIVTPEAKVFDGPAAFVAVPAHDGEFGFLPGRAPLVCKLAIGILRLTDETDKTHHWFVDGGFAQMVENRLTVLTRQAADPEAIDADAERQAIDAARAEPATNEQARTARSEKISRAETKLKLVASR